MSIGIKLLGGNVFKIPLVANPLSHKSILSLELANRLTGKYSQVGWYLLEILVWTSHKQEAAP